MGLIFVVLVLQLIARALCQVGPLCGDEVRITPLTQAVRIGGNATISCRQQTGSVTFGWFFLSPDSTNAVLLQPTDGHLTNDANTLFITNVTADDFGTYSCERLNSPSCISDNRSILTLFEQATIQVTPKQNRNYAGKTLNLTTAVTGNPLPATITLEKESTPGDYVDYANEKYSVIGLRTILILDLSLEDSGQYRVCVENTHDAINCDTFTIVVTGLEIIPPMATIKSGSNFSVVCRVINPFGSNFEMTWSTYSGDDITNDPLVQVTRLNASDWRLSVERVTDMLDYVCALRSDSEILTFGYIRVDVIDVPGPPRNLRIQSEGSNGLMAITWTAPATDNGSPLTAYYVNITVEGTSTVIRVPLHTTRLEHIAHCKVVNVTVASENACGNSSVDKAGIDARDQCVSSVPEPDESNGSVFPAIGAGIAVVTVFIALTLLITLFSFMWYKKQKKRTMHVFNPESLPTITVNKSVVTISTTPPPAIKRNTSIRRYRNMLEIPRDNVALRDFLCDGVYFELRKALLTIPENDNKTHEVMIKKAKQSAPSEEEHNIQEEIKMMSSVGVHENVVGLLRTCSSESPAYLITEYFAHGDLLGFLRASRGHYGMYSVSPGIGYKTSPCAVQGQDLLKIVTQVAAGMDYLAEKKVTHRSLCARNVLVATGLQVKIYNYGPKANGEGTTPPNYAKWMAPEMLFDGTADSMSDIWSFGVTFWEIITIGGSPYPQTHPEQMRELLQSGHRLPKPSHCADALYTVMDQCWKMDPNARPTFTVVYKQLDAMCKSKLSYLDSSLYNEEEYSQFEDSSNLMTAL